MSISKSKKSILERILFPSRKTDRKKLNKKVSCKIILITGATYGIGEHLAYMLANVDVTLILVGRTQEKLLYLQKDLEKKGATVFVYAANLQDMDQVDGLISYINQVSPHIDIFVNNAGKSIRRSIYRSLDRFHDFTRTMSLNYYAPVKLSLALIPILERRKGQIINISALNVLLAPAPYWAAYQASKSAFDSWIRCCLPELRVKGITLTSVYLPLVRTRMIEPTQAYERFPALLPSEAAKIICNAIIKRNEKYSPWWTLFPSVASVLFRKQCENIMTYYIRTKRGQ